MRNISFMLTTEQVRSRTKTVTRRLGWKNVKVGERLQGCVKCMGRKHGEPLEKLAVIEVVSVRREQLVALTDNIEYGFEEVKLEGLAEHPLVMGFPTQFIDFFCNSHNGCLPSTEVTRIEFKYV